MLDFSLRACVFEPQEVGGSGGLMGWQGLGGLVSVAGGKWDRGGQREGRGGAGRLVSRL